MKIKPLGERVLIKPIKAKERTDSGIYLPEEAKEEKKEAEVIEVGELKDGKSMPLKRGDKVIYGGYSSTEIEINDEEYLIIDYKDIVAIIEED